MARRHRAKKRLIGGDPTYNNALVHMLANRIMKDGKKALAYKIVYGTIRQLTQKTNRNGLRVLERAVQNVKPRMEVKARRVGGSTYQVPYEVKPERATVLALQWILNATRKTSGKPTVTKLTNEMLNAFNKTGSAIKRRTESHRMAASNKAFTRFRI